MLSNRSQISRNNDVLKLQSPTIHESKLEENEYKYLPLITRVSQEQLDPKWKECKIEGKNLLPRSNSAITIHMNHLYLYGGYQFAIGIMKDFYKLNFASETFTWHKLANIGPRCRHTLCTYKDSIYLFGGQVADSISTNEIFVYDVIKEEWKKIQNNPTYPPPLDSHCAVTYNDQWIMFGGFFGGKICQHSNKLYSYQFDNNTWIQLNQGQGLEPAPRDGSSLTYVNSDIYMFGGKNGDLRYNDLWQFNINNREWKFIANNALAVVPRSRSGHSLINFANKLILFGGIHDVTWELDDLYVFNLDTQEWEVINSDSSRREQELPSPPKSSRNPQKQRRTTKTKFPLLLRPMSLRKSPCPSPKKFKQGFHSEHSSFSVNNNLSQDYNGNQNTVNTLINNVQERKKQEQLRKKTAMLKLFEVKNRESMNFEDDCNVTEKLKTSIILTGNPKQDLKIKTGVLTEFGKPLVSRFLLPVTAGQNTINGKKPCARDGHATTLYQNKMIVFGGDRHTMSFNDLFLLELSQL